jgi:hypothetical protein
MTPRLPRDSLGASGVWKNAICTHPIVRSRSNSPAGWAHHRGEESFVAISLNESQAEADVFLI